MAMGTRESEQASLWMATSELPKSPGHPFYAWLTAILEASDFDRFMEGLCAGFWAPVLSGLPPGRYLRLLMAGYFEGIDSERGIARRATDSLMAGVFCVWRSTRRRPLTRRSRALDA